MRVFVALDEIEIDRLLIGFSYRQRYLRRALSHKMETGYAQHHARQSLPAIRGMHAELRDMAALLADSRTEHQGHEFAAAPVYDHVRCGSGERSAPRIADDVIQKAH